MSEHLRLAWRSRIVAGALPEDRYGTKARVEGHPSANCVAVYNRDTDTIIFVPKVPSSYDPDRLQPENLRPPGGIDYYKPPGSKYPPTGLGNGAALDIENGEIAPGSSAGVSPTSTTMFNPLYIEALERLLDTFPEMGRWTIIDASPGSGGQRRGTARDWLVNVNDMRSEFAASRKLAWSQVCLYHGTMGLYAEEIMREGLSPRNATGVENHWLGDNGQWASREGLVYLSHPSRLTVSRSAMSKAADATADKLYGAEKKVIEDDYRRLSGKWFNRPSDTEPDRLAEYTADYEAHWSKDKALRDKIAADPRLEPVLLRVCIPREGWKNLRADEDTSEYADATMLMTNMPEWMGSIGSDAVVAYAGTIPPQWITVAARGQEALQAGMRGGPVFR